jgi:transposase
MRMRNDETPGISQSEAARKYGVPQPLISSWVKQGLIRVLRPGGRGRPYELVEEDVARLAAIYHEEAARSPHGLQGKRTRQLLLRKLLDELRGYGL